MTAGTEREVESQSKKEESAAGERKTRAAAALKQHWCIALRVVELIISVVAIGLIVDPVNTRNIITSMHHVAIIFSAYSAFIIITGILILAHVLGETPGWRTSLAFSVVGVVMFTAAAAVIFYDWHKSYYSQLRPLKFYYDLSCASGVFSVINVVVFLTHAVLTFRKEANV